MRVIKRDGSSAEYDKNRIESAILKAMIHGSGIVKPGIAKEIADSFDSIINSSIDKITVHDIEKEVYIALTDIGEIETAKAYEGYRAVQEYKRIVNTTDTDIINLLSKGAVSTVRENSNKNAVILATQRDLIAGQVSKDISKRKLLPARIVQAHDECAIHVHDMDYYLQSMTNCCLINLEDMLMNSTVINDKLVESPKSFSTACTVMTQIMAQVSSNQYGGQTVTIKHLAPFLRRSKEKAYNHYLNDMHLDEDLSHKLAEDLMFKDLKDGVQTIRYQLSTLQTSNGQSPFATIYLEVEVGHEFEKEMALIVEEMLIQRINGMKNYKGQPIGESFPKLVYLLDEANSLEGGKYDYLTELSAKCTALRLVPDYQSAKMLRKNYGDTFPPMGCRSHLSQYKDENGQLKWYGRFNQGVSSVNLPQIAILANKDMDLFWEILDSRLELCKESLMIRHNKLLGTLSDVSPIHWQYGALARLKKGEPIDKLLNSNYSTLSLGYVGIYEMTQAMLGVSHTTKEGEKFALDVMNYLKSKCDSWKAETGLGFSLYGTPAESLVYRFCNHDREVFGELPNVTDKLYYTNSYHINVKEKINAFDKLKFEAKFHDISLGGSISYIETPDMSKNIEAVKNIINFIYHNIQYAEVNTRPDICYKCGFKGELKTDKDLNWYCPSCGNRDESEMQVMRRTCGYIGTHFWNKGRTHEISDRVLHL